MIVNEDNVKILE